MSQITPSSPHCSVVVNTQPAVVITQPNVLNSQPDTTSSWTSLLDNPAVLAQTYFLPTQQVNAVKENPTTQDNIDSTTSLAASLDNQPCPNPPASTIVQHPEKLNTSTFFNTIAAQVIQGRYLKRILRQAMLIILVIAMIGLTIECIALHRFVHQQVQKQITQDHVEWFKKLIMTKNQPAWLQTKMEKEFAKMNNLQLPQELVYPSLIVHFWDGTHSLSKGVNSLGEIEMIKMGSQTDGPFVTHATCKSSNGPIYKWDCYTTDKRGNAMKTDYNVVCLRDQDGAIHPSTCRFYYHILP